MGLSEGLPHGEVVRLDTDEAWLALTTRYGQHGRVPALNRVLEVVRELGAQSVLVERSYTCADFRSELAGFYSSTFREYRSKCDRLHFFQEVVTPEQVRKGELGRATYLGYSVMRPLPWAPVGRTLIPPPPSSNRFICGVHEDVDVFGSRLGAFGVPFISQDGYFLRCAHAATWMVLYHAFRRHGGTRWLPADIHRAGLGGEVVGRQFPSIGLSPPQLLHALHALGVSPTHDPLPKSKMESADAGPQSLPALLCRYVNSQVPPIVYSTSHVWVVVGYRWIEDAPDHGDIEFYRHDDLLGPYLSVLDPWQEEEKADRPWIAAIAPLPRKCYLTANRAELLGTAALESLQTSVESGMPPTDTQPVPNWRPRTYAVRSSEFKEHLGSRGVPPTVAAAYRVAQWPRYIWVVEMMDASGRPSRVLGEAILDATALNSGEDPVTVLDGSSVLAVHGFGVFGVNTGEHFETGLCEKEKPYDSGRVSDG